MPLVSMKPVLRHALEGSYAVGQFNVTNHESMQAILLAAKEESSPVIVGVGEGTVRYLGGYRLVAMMVRELVEEYQVKVPVTLHLDHGSCFESCAKAIQAGFTSVMIDGSHLPLAENIAVTNQVVTAAYALGVSVEAEIGRITGEEDGKIVDDDLAMYASSSECHTLVLETGVDCLAPALGSVHGPYKGEPKLQFEIMKEVRDLTGVPLALHGGTGIPDKDIQTAISLGIAKINVNTENQMVFTSQVRKVLVEEPGLYDPRKYAASALDAMKESVKRKMREFGSAARAM